MIPLRSTFYRFFQAGFALAILILALVFCFAYQKIQLLSEASSQVNHTQVIRLELSQVNVLVQEATMVHRRFLTSRDSAFLNTLANRENDIFVGLDRLDSLIGNIPAQQSNLDSLRVLVNADLVLMKKVNWADIQKQAPVWTENRAAMDSIRAQVRRMDQAEVAVLPDREMNLAHLLRTTPVFALLLLLLGLIIATFSYLRIRNDLRRSQRQLEVNIRNTKQIIQLNETLQHAERISQTGNWQMNLRTGERQYSNNVYRLIGHEPDSFTPALDNWLPFVHPDDRQSVVDFAEVTRRKKTEPADIIFRLTRPDGQLRYFRAGARIITDATGEKTLIGTIQDITEAHQLRTELEERCRFAETIIESSVDIIVTYDTDLRITGWNKKSEEVFRKHSAPARTGRCRLDGVRQGR